MTAPLSDERLAEVLAHVPNCRYGCVACEAAPGLVAEIQRLRDAVREAATWTDPETGTVYDLTRAYRDDQDGFWRHAGWVGLPGEPRTPLMHWSATAEPPYGGIRRMSDLATLPAVIDECGPLFALPSGGAA